MSVSVLFEVLVDRVETRKKCTILPLGYREDFRIKRFRRGQPLPPLCADLFLHLRGAPLDELVRDGLVADVRCLGLLDCQWGRCDAILSEGRATLPRLARIPDGFVTAYRRQSRTGDDPAAGLASIEALFVAAAFLGHWDESLLREYHFGAAFLAANEASFIRYGLRPAAPDPAAPAGED